MHNYTYAMHISYYAHIYILYLEGPRCKKFHHPVPMPLPPPVRPPLDRLCTHRELDMHLE